MLETDHNTFTETSKAQRKQQMAEEMVQTAGEYEEVAAAEAAENFLSEELPENIFGAPKAGAGMWASCLRVMHPTEVSWLYLKSFTLSCDPRARLWNWFSLNKMKLLSGKSVL